MTLLIIYLMLAIVVSFFCSIAEATLLSVRPSYIVLLEERGKPSAKILKKLCDNLDRPLAAILTANTIAHTVGAAGVGAQAGIVFENVNLALISGILTFLILVFSEIIPKTIGAAYWKQLAPTFAYMIDILSKALFPFVWMSEKLTRMIAKSKASYTFSRDEIKAMAFIGAKEGLLDDKELKILNGLMQLNKLSIRSIMTPRSVMFSVSDAITVKEFFSIHGDKAYSRIPVFSENEDNITQYVMRSDLLVSQAKGEAQNTLKTFSREFLVLPDILKVSGALDKVLQEQSHIALVVDEYGSVQGIVTLEDMIEALIGFEIVDEHDEIEDLQNHALELWKERMKSKGNKMDS